MNGMRMNELYAQEQLRIKKEETARKNNCFVTEVCCERCKYRNEFHIMLWCDLWHSKAPNGGYGFCTHFDKEK